MHQHKKLSPKRIMTGPHTRVDSHGGVAHPKEITKGTRTTQKSELPKGKITMGKVTQAGLGKPLGKMKATSKKSTKIGRL